MKNIKIDVKILFFVGLVITGVISASQEPIEPRKKQTIWSRSKDATERAKKWIYSTRLFAGYHSTPEEKKAALEKIKDLLYEREQLEDLYENQDLSDEELVVIEKNIVKINNDIYTQKIITGDKWTGIRSFVWGSIGAGVALAGLKLGYGKTRQGKASKYEWFKQEKSQLTSGFSYKTTRIFDPNNPPTGSGVFVLRKKKFNINPSSMPEYITIKTITNP